MTKLMICRGLQASGKTTAAKDWVAEDPENRIRVNRDDLRKMLHVGQWSSTIERGTIVVRDAAIKAALERGISVVNDDTNLSQRVARDVARIGRLAGAEIEVWDFTYVPLEECIARDKSRFPDKSVGEDVIRRTYDRYLRGRDLPLPFPNDNEETTELRPYVPNGFAPWAVMVDIDGTVALRGNRSPFDETRVHEDRPNLPVIRAVDAAHRAGYKIIFCSGRTEACRNATESWLQKYVQVPREHLFMRAEGDRRNDAIVKMELFDRYIRDNYYVHWVFDDRNRVVDAWRSIGLPVFQVAPGDF